MKKYVIYKLKTSDEDNVHISAFSSITSENKQLEYIKDTCISYRVIDEELFSLIYSYGESVSALRVHLDRIKRDLYEKNK